MGVIKAILLIAMIMLANAETESLRDLSVSGSLTIDTAALAAAATLAANSADATTAAVFAATSAALNTGLNAGVTVGTTGLTASANVAATVMDWATFSLNCSGKKWNTNADCFAVRSTGYKCCAGTLNVATIAITTCYANDNTATSGSVGGALAGVSYVCSSNYIMYGFVVLAALFALLF